MLRLRDIITTDVVTVTPETTLQEAMELFGTRHVSGAPVVANGKLVGVVSTTDLMLFAASTSGVPTQRDAADDAPDDDSASIAELEAENDAGPIFFADLWDDAGADVAARMNATASPEWNLLDEHTVSEVMTRAPLTTLPPTAGVEWAAELMRRRRIHRILVTEDEAVVGIVSALDIVAAVADHRLTARTFVFQP